MRYALVAMLALAVPAALEAQAQSNPIPAPARDEALRAALVSRAYRPRHALHAHRLVWKGDATVPAFAVESPLPPDLAALVEE